MPTANDVLPSMGLARATELVSALVKLEAAGRAGPVLAPSPHWDDWYDPHGPVPHGHHHGIHHGIYGHHHPHDHRPPVSPPPVDQQAIIETHDLILRGLFYAFQFPVVPFGSSIPLTPLPYHVYQRTPATVLADGRTTPPNWIIWDPEQGGGIGAWVSASMPSVMARAIVYFTQDAPEYQLLRDALTEHVRVLNLRITEQATELSDLTASVAGSLANVHLGVRWLPTTNGQPPAGARIGDYWPEDNGVYRKRQLTADDGTTQDFWLRTE